MSGITMGAVGGFFTPHLVLLQNFTTPSGVGTVACTVQFLSNGSLVNYKGDPLSPTVVPQPNQWCIPQGSGFSPGTNFEARFALTTGTINVGASFLDGSWYSLGTFAPNIGTQRTGVGAQSGEFTVTIRNKNTLIVLASSTINVNLT